MMYDAYLKCMCRTHAHARTNTLTLTLTLTHTHTHTHARSYAYVQNGKGAFDHAHPRAMLIHDEWNGVRTVRVLHRTCACAECRQGGRHGIRGGGRGSEGAKEIKDKEKREAVLTVLADFSVMSAVALGKADLVAAAVAKGCNVDETDCEKNTCLHLAVNQGSIEIVRMLVEAGADVNSRNNAGETPLSWAYRQRADVQAILLKAGERERERKKRQAYFGVRERDRE